MKIGDDVVDEALDALDTALDAIALIDQDGPEPDDDTDNACGSTESDPDPPQSDAA